MSVKRLFRFSADSLISAKFFEAVFKKHGSGYKGTGY